MALLKSCDDYVLFGPHTPVIFDALWAEAVYVYSKYRNANLSGLDRRQVKRSLAISAKQALYEGAREDNTSLSMQTYHNFEQHPTT